MPDPHHLVSTRSTYDAVAVDYAALLDGELEQNPTDRAVLGVFAELVAATPPGPVADLGCGPGRITAHLATLGLPVLGMDLSPGMIAEARRRHPELPFAGGSLLDLPLDEAALAGAVAWYSLIHIPPAEQPVAFAELARVVRRGGYLLAAFQGGDDLEVHHRQAYGHEVSLTGYRMSAERVVDELVHAGFSPYLRLVREPVGPFESTPQVYLVLRRGD